MPRSPALGAIVLTVLASYLYAIFEWGFLATQRGFMVSLPASRKLGALALPPLAAVAVLLVVLAALLVVERVAPRGLRRSLIVGALLPAGILTALAFLLIDNFTYTVLGIGVVTAGPWTRFLYVPILAGLLVQATRVLARTRRAWASEGIPAWLTAAPLFLLVISGAVAIASPAGSSPPARPAGQTAGTGRERSNVLLVTIDGVEARRMSVYGSERRTTPFLERFRDHGIIFENAFSNAGRTTGSLTALLTSKPPTATKVIFPPHILTGGDAFEHLPGLLRRAGYRTFQFSVRYYADAADLNMRAAFDHANGRDLPAGEPGPIARRFPAESYFAERVVERLSERLLYVLGISPIVNYYRLVQLPTSIYGEHSDRERARMALDAIRGTDQPFFVHLHLMGTHCCGFRVRRPVFSAGPDPSRRDRLDDALVEADGEVERLIDRMRRAGKLENTLVIVSSDHTASWGTLERVPLLVRLPGASGRQVVHRNVQLIDLAPTVLDVVGIGQPAWMEGASLLRPGDSATRLIESATEIRKEVVDADWERISRLQDPSPPYYGLSAVGGVVCDKWIEIALRSGDVTTGVVDGHTRPCDPLALPSPSAVGLGMLLLLESRGFALPLSGADLGTLRERLGRARWPDAHP